MVTTVNRIRLSVCCNRRILCYSGHGRCVVGGSACCSDNHSGAPSCSRCGVGAIRKPMRGVGDRCGHSLGTAESRRAHLPLDCCHPCLWDGKPCG